MLPLQVAAELEAQHANPIAADGLVLDAMLERAFDRAHEVKSKQTALTAEQGLRDSEMEEVFFAGILFQRDQVAKDISLYSTGPPARDTLLGNRGSDFLI